MEKAKDEMISVIIPVKDEKDNVKSLFAEIRDAMLAIGGKWECIWVDDASSDGTTEILLSLKKDNPEIRVVKHLRCFGQSAALVSGFRSAKGEIIVTLDGDGQNDPSSIPDLIKTLCENKADMVNGWREKRLDSVVRKMSSKIANGFRNFVTGEKIRDVGCALRAFRKKCIQDIVVFKGMHRFLPTLIRIAGYPEIMEIPVRHRPRIRGKTKYGISNRLWVGIYDVFAVLWMRSRLVFPKAEEKE